MIPVEPVSLTIGAVALASLFSLCIQCFDLIDIGQRTSIDYEKLVLRLGIEKRRLMIWGEAVGILRPDQDRDPLLDEPVTRELVQRTLSNLQRLFGEARDLRSKYGLEKTAPASVDSTFMVAGSAVCSLSLDSSPLVQFQTRFLEHRKKAGFVEKTRWAIRDSKKFAALIQDLKDLVDGLNEITISTRSTILKTQLIREETESITDLDMLKTIESTCSDADWSSAASSASAYFNLQDRLTPQKRGVIQDWVNVDSDRQAPHGSSPGHIRGRMPPDADSTDYSPLQARPSPPVASGPMRLRLKAFDTPHEKTDTQVLVLCSTNALVAWITGESNKTFKAIHDIPNITTANAITTTRMMKAIVPPSRFNHPSIAIYCPPRSRFVHLAMSILNPHGQIRRGFEGRIHIRFDDRLLDRTTSFSGVAQRMKGYYRDIEDCVFTTDDAQERIWSSIDMNWLEQRIEVLDNASYLPVLDELEWSTIFRQSRDDTQCAGIIVMAGVDTCWKMLNAEPVVPPETFQDGRVYRLRELDGGDPRYKWKAEHYCNVSTDHDFRRIYGGGNEE